MKSFGSRLSEQMQQRGPLCVGIDPHPKLLEAWGLADNAAGVREFSLKTLRAVGTNVAAIKPQSAFFERHGSAGIAVLEELLTTARDQEVLTILDVKRGDIGSTMRAYAESYLVSGAPLEADAITLSPYLGVDSLMPAFEIATENAKGAFVLTLTSNPEGASVQHRRDLSGEPLAKAIVRRVSELNKIMCESYHMPSFGLVIGATTGAAVRDLEIVLTGDCGPILSPGIGFQGAGIVQLTEVFQSSISQVLASVSRDVLQAGPDENALKVACQDLVRDLQKLPKT